MMMVSGVFLIKSFSSQNLQHFVDWVIWARVTIDTLLTIIGLYSYQVQCYKNCVKWSLLLLLSLFRFSAYWKETIYCCNRWCGSCRQQMLHSNIKYIEIILGLYLWNRHFVPIKSTKDVCPSPQMMFLFLNMLLVRKRLWEQH